MGNGASIVKVTDVKTGKLKGFQNPDGRWIAKVVDGSLSTTDYGYRAGYRTKDNKLYTEFGSLAY
jgi:hypothetical protein